MDAWPRHRRLASSSFPVCGLFLLCMSRALWSLPLLPCFRFDGHCWPKSTFLQLSVPFPLTARHRHMDRARNIAYTSVSLCMELASPRAAFSLLSLCVLCCSSRLHRRRSVLWLLHCWSRPPSQRARRGALRWRAQRLAVFYPHRIGSGACLVSGPLQAGCAPSPWSLPSHLILFSRLDVYRADATATAANLPPSHFPHPLDHPLLHNPPNLQVLKHLPDVEPGKKLWRVHCAVFENEYSEGAARPRMYIGSGTNSSKGLFSRRDDYRTRRSLSRNTQKVPEEGYTMTTWG